MDVASARMYIAMLSAMSLHNAAAPAWMLLRNSDIIGARVHDIVPLLMQHRPTFLPFAWMSANAPITVIGTMMPSEQAAMMISKMNIAAVYYLHPPVNARSNIIMRDAGISVTRLLLV